MRMFMFEALVQGLPELRQELPDASGKSLLPFSGKLLTMECGIRFLTDYLSGDVYFKIHRPNTTWTAAARRWPWWNPSRRRWMK